MAVSDEELLDLRLQVLRKRSLERRGAINSQSLPSPTDAQGQPEITQDVSPVENVMRGVAKEQAEMFGFLGDIALGTGKLAGELLVPEENLPQAELDAFDERFDASRAFESLLQGVGVETETVEPRSGAERLALNVIPPVSAGLGALGLARKTTGAAGQALQKNFKRFAGVDSTAAATGGVLKSGAQALGANDPTANVVELTANLIAGGFADRAVTLKEMAQAGPELLQAKTTQALSTFNDRERDIASAFLKENIARAGEDASEIAAIVEAPGPSGAELLTPGARSRSPALQALENSVIKNDPAAADQFARRKEDLHSFISNQLRIAAGDEGLPQDVIDTYLASAAHRTEMVERSLQQKMAQVDEFLRETPDELFDASTEVKKVLREAEEEAREIEKEMWEALPVTEAPLSPIIDKFRDIMEEAKIDDFSRRLENFPDSRTLRKMAETSEENAAAIKVLDETEEAVFLDPNAVSTTDELLALRSNLLEDAAKASFDQKKKLSRRLYALADSVLEALKQSGSSQEQAEALAFSKSLNDRFSRDVIAPLLSQSARRGELVPGNEMMEKIIKPGPAGATNMRALILAARGVPPQARTAILQRFWGRVLANGSLNTKKAENFRKEFRPLLHESGLLDLIDRTIDAGKQMDAASDDLAFTAKTLKEEQVAKVVDTFGKRGDNLIDAIEVMFRSKQGNPQKKLTAMFNELENLEGTTPEAGRMAIDGMRSAVAEGALKALYTEAGESTAGVGRTIKRIQLALEETGRYSDEQISRIGELGQLISEAATAERRQIFKGQSNTPQDLGRARIMSEVLRFLAVRFAAPVVKGGGPGSLHVAGQAGRLGAALGDKIGVENASELIRMAIFDQELFLALMKRGDEVTPGDVGTIRRALNSLAKTSLGLVRRTVTGALQPSQASVSQGVVESIEQEQQDGR